MIDNMEENTAVMTQDSFLALPTSSVARIVSQAGTRTCAIPMNGSRRWFQLIHLGEMIEDPIGLYLEEMAQRQVEVYQLLFDHGIFTLLAPVIGSDVFTRGGSYDRVVAALDWLAVHPVFVDYYHQNKIKVQFYGDYRKYLAGTAYEGYCQLFDDLTAATAHYTEHRLFYGLFGSDATEAVARIAVRHYQKHGDIPSRRQIITTYYGEYVDPVALFIGFDKFAVFDTPLVALGDEDVYFTIAPQYYMTERQLRIILYDHLYARRGQAEYDHLKPEDWAIMDGFYKANQDRTLGVGTSIAGIWYPTPQVATPPSLKLSSGEKKNARG